MIRSYIDSSLEDTTEFILGLTHPLSGLGVGELNPLSPPPPPLLVTLTNYVELPHKHNYIMVPSTDEMPEILKNVIFLNLLHLLGN